MGRKIEGHDASKLPKWAQRRLDKLEADVAHYKAKALAVAAEGPGAPVAVRTFEDIDSELGLPDETIRFYPDPSDRERYLEVDRKSFGIEVSSARFLGVRPTSTNRVFILFEDSVPRSEM